MLVLPAGLPLLHIFIVQCETTLRHWSFFPTSASPDRPRWSWGTSSQRSLPLPGWRPMEVSWAGQSSHFQVSSALMMPGVLRALRHTFCSKNILFLCSLCHPYPDVSSSGSAFLFLTLRELLIAMWAPVPGQCPISYHSMPVLLCVASWFSTFQGLCYCTGLYFSALCHCVRAINISF